MSETLFEQLTESIRKETRAKLLDAFRNALHEAVERTFREMSEENHPVKLPEKPRPLVKRTKKPRIKKEGLQISLADAVVHVMKQYPAGLTIGDIVQDLTKINYRKPVSKNPINMHVSYVLRDLIKQDAAKKIGIRKGRYTVPVFAYKK